MKTIPITKPFFDHTEKDLIGQVLETGWVVQGPKVEEFERLLCAYTGSTHSVATSSCTTALHLALLATGVGPGDEVIVPAFTWISTANVVEYVGAKPVFCDIDLSTFNLNPEAVKASLSERTKAIIPVHLFGLCADMRSILEIAEQRGLAVIEDAACALGAWYFEKHAGTMGDAGCFSFHPRKSITTGEGGMLITANEEIATLSSVLRDHGGSITDRQRHDSATSFLLPEFAHLGFNYRMTDLQGALGCAQMDKVDWIMQERRRRAGAYDSALNGCEWLTVPRVPKGHVHGYQAYVCLFVPERPSLDNVEHLHSERNRIMAKLQKGGVATRPGTHAVHVQKYYAQKYGIAPDEFPQALLADRLALALPLFPQMTDSDQERVVNALTEV